MYKKIVCAILALAGMITEASSGIITYDETVNGDLNGGQHLVFDHGLNTVSGSITFSNEDLVPDDFDSFDFSLTAGSTLKSVFIDIRLLDVGSGIWDTADWSVNNSGVFEEISFPSLNRNLFESFLPLTEGIFNLTHNSSGGSLRRGAYRVAEYTFSFEVSNNSVPEPTSIILLGLGIAGLLFTRRSRLKAGA